MVSFFAAVAVPFAFWGFWGTTLAAGAVAASIPIVIHLLNRRRYQVVAWAAMRFLLQAKKQNTRRMRLEQLVLLAVRVLLILLLVAAMASVMPWAESVWAYFWPEGAGAGRARVGRAHKILVIDGTLSTATRLDPERTCFQKAQELASALIEDAEPGDGFSVLVLKDSPTWVVGEVSPDGAKVAQEIKALRGAHGNGDVPTMLNMVAAKLAESPARFRRREVYFFTDLQTATWAGGGGKGPEAPAAAQNTLQQIRSRAETAFVDVGRKEATNLAVTSLSLGDSLVGTESLVPVSATVQHFGGAPRDQLRVHLLAGRARESRSDAPFELRSVAQKVVDIQPGQKVTVNFSHKFTRAGTYALQVRIEGDDLPPDDVRTVVLTVKETIPVLLVNGQPAVDRFATATEYLRLALNPFPDGSVPKYAPLRPKVITTSQFADASESNLAGYDCIFLADVGQLGIGEMRRLQTHVQRGGGVVVSLGPAAADHLEAYNRLLYRGGDGLLPAKLVGSVQAPPKHYFTPYAAKEAFETYPLKAFADDDDRIALLRSRVDKYVKAEPAADPLARTLLSLMPEADPGVKADATLPVGNPLLVEWNPPRVEEGQEGGRRPGAAGRYRGKVVLLTSTWNLDWNSWAASPSYLPMVQELVRLAVSGRLRERSVTVNAPLEEFLVSSGAELDVNLFTPESPESDPVKVRTTGAGDITTFRWSGADVSGIYRATVGQDTGDYLFAVNVPPWTADQKGSESDPARVTEADLRAAYPGWDFQLVQDPARVQHRRAPDDDGVEQVPGVLGPAVANYLLLAVLLLLFLEVVLACVFGHFSAVAGGAAEPVRRRPVLPALVAAAAAVLFVAIFGVLGHAVATGDFLGFLPDGFRSAVENWLGIPPPESGEGSRWALEFSPYLVDVTTDRWLAGGLALGAVLMLFLVYRQEGPKVAPAYKALTAGLRLFLILFTLAVLLPQVQLNFERQNWPDVVILLDDSLSMGESDHYQDKEVQRTVATLAERIKKDLQAALPAKLKDLQARLRDAEPRPGPEGAAAAERLKAEAAAAEARLGQLDSTNWRPTRLEIAQALVNGEPAWLSSILADRRMKVHLYHLDGTGRAIKLTGEQGQPLDLTDPSEGASVAAAGAAVAGLDPQANESRLGVAVRQVIDHYRGASLAAVVMVTDGVTTREEGVGDVAEYAAQKGVPLFLVGVGDDHELRDLKLHDLQVEDTVYVNDRIIFEARLTGKGFRDLKVPVLLKVRDKDGKEVELAREIVDVDPAGKPVRVRLTHQPTEPGEKLFIIEVVPPKEDDQAEADYSNLRLQRTIFVQEAKLIKVLYVEGSARYEYRFLKALLEREKEDSKKNKSVELKVLLVDSDPDYPRQDATALSEFPFNKVELFQYDVVILGDVDPQCKQLGDEKLRLLADFVRERGGGLLMIGGPLFSPYAYRNTPLADVLPITPPDLPPEEPLVRDNNYRLELTPVGRLHPIFRFSPSDAENVEIWEGLSPMYWYAEGYQLKPLAEVLAVHPRVTGGRGGARAGEDTRLPLVVQHFVGSGRCMFFGFDESWRWRFRENEKRFNQFWIQTVRYLSRNRVSRTDLRLDRQTPYRQGEPIKVTVRFPDNQPLPGEAERLKAGMKTEVKVIAEHHPPGGQGQPADVEVQTLQLAKVSGSWATYEGLLNRTREGKYRFWLSTPDVSQLQPNKQKPSAEAVVVLPPGELDRLRMNRAELEKAAEVSDGKFYTVATAGSVLDDLPPGYRVTLNSPGPPHLIWNHSLSFLLVLLLLSSEWVLRKRKHLL